MLIKGSLLAYFSSRITDFNLVKPIQIRNFCISGRFFEKEIGRREGNHGITGIFSA